MSKLIFERRNQKKNENKSNNSDESDIQNKSNVTTNNFNVGEEIENGDLEEYKREIDRILEEKKKKLESVFTFNKPNFEEKIKQKFEKELEEKISQEKEKFSKQFEIDKKKEEEKYKEKLEQQKQKAKEEIEKKYNSENHKAKSENRLKVEAVQGKPLHIEKFYALLRRKV